MAIHSRILVTGLAAEANAKATGTQLVIEKVLFGSGHTAPVAADTGLETPLVPPQETDKVSYQAAAVANAWDLGYQIEGTAEFSASEIVVQLAGGVNYARIVDDTGDLVGKNRTQVFVGLLQLQYVNPVDASTVTAATSAPLALLVASTTVRGAVFLATPDEARAGTDGGKAMTAATTVVAVQEHAKLPVRRVYEASAVWNKPANLAWVVVEAWGGGAGSRLRAAQQASGGGGGGYARAVIAAADLAATEAVTVGAGGAGSSQTPGVTNSGGAGGDSSFGTHCVARGGGRDINGAVAGGPHYSSTGGGQSSHPVTNHALPYSWAGGNADDPVPIVWAASGGGSVSSATITPPALALYDGGRGGVASVGAGGAGTAPGGGGGGGLTSQGAGARGEVRLIEYYE